MRRLAGVVTLYIAVTLCWLLVLPPFEGPDELQHYDYARYVAVNGHLPDTVPAVINEGGWYTGLWVHEGLYYGLFAQLLDALDAQAAPPLVTPNRAASYTGGREAAAFLHAAPLPAPLSRGLWAGRLANACLGLGTIVCVFFALAGTTGRSDLAALATGCLILVPEFGVRHAFVSNDALATLCASGAALWILRWSPQRAPWWHAAAIGAISGCAVATKLPAGAIILMMPIACWLARRDPGARLAGHLLAWGLGLLAGGAWPFVRNWMVFGDPMAMPIKQAAIAQLHYQPGFDPTQWQAYVEFARLAWRSFWATIGWAGFRPPAAWIWAVFAAWTVVCGAGFLSAACGRAGRSRVTTMALVVVGVTGLAFVVSASRFPGHSARYLLPVTVPAMVAVVHGLRILAVPIRHRFGDAPLAWASWAGALALGLAWLGTFQAVVLAYHFGVTS